MIIQNSDMISSQNFFLQIETIKHRLDEKEEKKLGGEWVQSRAYLVQEGAVADLLPDAEHGQGGGSGEHGGAGVPEQRALRPHGSIHQRLSWFAEGGAQSSSLFVSQPCVCCLIETNCCRTIKTLASLSSCFCSFILPPLIYSPRTSFRSGSALTNWDHGLLTLPLIVILTSKNTFRTASVVNLSKLISRPDHHRLR